MVKVLPRPGSLCTDTLPPCASMMRCTRCRPSPLPWNLARHGLAAAIERLEDVLAIVGGDAEAAILDRDAQRRLTRLRADTAPSAHRPPYLMALPIRFWSADRSAAAHRPRTAGSGVRHMSIAS